VSATDRLSAVAGMALLAGTLACGGSPRGAQPAPAKSMDREAGAGILRLTGTVEAVQVRTVSVPRLLGPQTPLLIIGLVPAGSRVKPGELVVEFDPQQQERNAFDRRAEAVNLDGQIDKKRAGQTADEAKDKTELTAAENDVERAGLEMRKNGLLPRNDAEKNTLALQQATARFDQLKITYDLKRKAAAAEIRILEIQRERADRALRYAQQNAALMQTKAPFSGLVVIKRNYRNGAFVEIAEGDEVRPNTPILDLVDTSVMRVRVRLNQADARLVHAGQRAKIGLDGFPDLKFDGQVTTVTPLASPSQLSRTVRSFAAIVSIEGSHPQLLPDLTASVDIVPDRVPVVPVQAALEGGR
jgi:HlyD family secretion protein